MLTEPHTPPPRRAVANIAADIALRERTHPAGFEGTDDARRYGADLLGRALGHAGATLHDLAWYEIYAAAAYDGLALCPTLHIMAAQAMDATRPPCSAPECPLTPICGEHQPGTVYVGQAGYAECTTDQP
jgi:hypothetical protein